LAYGHRKDLPRYGQSWMDCGILFGVRNNFRRLVNLAGGILNCPIRIEFTEKLTDYGTVNALISNIYE